MLLSVACISSVLCIFELCTCSSSLICCFFNTFVCILPCVTNIILKDTLIKGVIWDIFSFRIVFRNIKSTTQLRFVISTIYVCKGCLGFFYCVVLPIICTIILNNYYRMISCQYISYIILICTICIICTPPFLLTIIEYWRNYITQMLILYIVYTP